MKILFLMMNLSDLNKPSGMYSDLIDEFIRNGHDIYPVAASLNNTRTCISVENGVNVLRVNTLPLFNVNILLKGLANILLPFQYKNALNKYFSDIKPDLIIVPTPPVSLADIVRPLKKKYRAKVYLILRDIFPQNAVDLGIIKRGGLLYRFFRKKEISLYRHSDLIGCMSEGNIRYLLKHNPELSLSKLHILMNFQKVPKSFLESREGLEWSVELKNRFTVVFGGNMGVPQKIENVIALAKRCMVYNDVVFLFIGDGTQRNKIERLAREGNVTNISFKDYIPREQYQRVLDHCHIGLISLNEKYTIPNIPSKTMAYFSAGLPVLASIDEATDYGKILQEAGAGLVSVAGDIESFFHNFCTLYNSTELRTRMGKNGKEFFMKKMTSEAAYNTIMNNVQSRF